MRNDNQNEHKNKKGCKKSLPAQRSVFLCFSEVVLWPLLIFECCLQVVDGNKSVELRVCVRVCVFETLKPFPMHSTLASTKIRFVFANGGCVSSFNTSLPLASHNVQWYLKWSSSTKHQKTSVHRDLRCGYVNCEHFFRNENTQTSQWFHLRLLYY